MTQRTGIKQYLIGDRPFYREVVALALPMIIQNTLSNVVSLLDNIMVGAIGTLQMSAVAIVSQLMLIFYLCIFGIVAGAGIYGAQFFGKGDDEGVRAAMRFKLLTAVILSLAVMAIFFIFEDTFIELYIAKETSAKDAAATLLYGKDYMNIMLLGMVPFSLTQCYASMLRETKHTRVPMIASIVAMVVNFVFNALLIFGLFGFPKLGVVGAAIATVLSRFIEAFIVIISAHRGKKVKNYFKGLYTRFRIPGELAGDMAKKTLPLMINELGWSFAQAAILQTYSLKGIGVVAALNIANTISVVFYELHFSLGTATSIIVGQKLGADSLQEAKVTAYRMLALSFEACAVIGVVLCLLSPFIPMAYNTEPEIRTMAARMLLILGIFMPVDAFATSLYCTLRAGGKVFITFLFDSGFSILITVVVVNILIRLTGLPVITVYIINRALEILKCIIGFIILKSGVWINNLVKDTAV